jgi:hypothetical protein
VQEFREQDFYPSEQSPPDRLQFAAEWLLNPGWIVEVAKTPDADLRAHRVALTYHYYARDLDRCINGPDSVWFRMRKRLTPTVKDANWFNFGTWATATINRDLTLRQPPAGSDRFVPFGFRRAMTPVLLHLRAAEGQRVSRALGWGQRLVFLSTTFIHLARRSDDPDGGLLMDDDPRAVARREKVFRSILKWSEWDSTAYIDKDRHLPAIWSAFGHYAKAAETAKRLRRLREAGSPGRRGSPEARVAEGRCRRLEAIRSRHMLFGNLLVTAVEQEIVNQAVGDVINNMPTYLSQEACGRIALWGERFFGVQPELTSRYLPRRAAPATYAFQEAWARFMTEQVLVMMLPTETLRLGRDLPPLYPGKPFFPPSLSDLSTLPGFDLDPNDDDDRKLLADLRLFVTAFDRSRGNGRGTGARDWRNYSDRMNWATSLLRSRQQDLSLFWAPYSMDDDERIVEGRLPHRLGDPSQYDVNAPFTYLGIGPHVEANGDGGGGPGSTNWIQGPDSTGASASDAPATNRKPE